MPPLNEDMLKYKQYGHLLVPMDTRITVSIEKRVCTQMALLSVDRERRGRESHAVGHIGSLL
jgi:hypothetical protein